MVYWGAWGKLIYEKNQKQKILWHCPFNFPSEWWSDWVATSGNSSTKDLPNAVAIHSVNKDGVDPSIIWRGKRYLASTGIIPPSFASSVSALPNIRPHLAAIALVTMAEATESQNMFKLPPNFSYVDHLRFSIWTGLHRWFIHCRSHWLTAGLLSYLNVLTVKKVNTIFLICKEIKRDRCKVIYDWWPPQTWGKIFAFPHIWLCIFLSVWVPVKGYTTSPWCFWSYVLHWPPPSQQRCGRSLQSPWSSASTVTVTAQTLLIHWPFNRPVRVSK